DSVVKVYADLNNNGTLDPTDLLIGQTVATPIDGTNQYPGGRWVVTTTVDLNNPTYFPIKDGLRQFLVTAEDPAGNVSSAQTLDVFIDTEGPQVLDVQITNALGFDLFGLKPTNASQGPTPMTYSLTITLQDLPAIDALGMFARQALDPSIA